MVLISCSPSSGDVSMPANNTESDIDFGGTTDDERYDFCDRLYTNLLVAFDGRLKTLVEVDESGEPIPGTYSSTGGGVVVSIDENKDFTITYKGVNAGLHFENTLFWGSVSVEQTPEAGSMMDYSFRVSAPDGSIFDISYKETLGEYPTEEDPDNNWQGTFTLNGREIEKKNYTPR